jgi:hypothetical protein
MARNSIASVNHQAIDLAWVEQCQQFLEVGAIVFASALDVNKQQIIVWFDAKASHLSIEPKQLPL